MADEPTSFSRKTSLDWFVGTILGTEIDLTPELYTLMKMRATEYINVSGGLPQWNEWVMLGQGSRDAFMEALSDMRIRSALDSK